NARRVAPPGPGARRAHRRDPQGSRLRCGWDCGAAQAQGGRMIRSLLYVPASSERFVAKAHERGADAIILDLEDAVAPQEKARARTALAQAVPAVARNGATVFVRINAVSSGIAFDEAGGACRAGAFGLSVATVQPPADLARLDELLDVTEREIARERPMVLVPMLGDPGAVLDARTLAGASRRTFALV